MKKNSQDQAPRTSPRRDIVLLLTHSADHYTVDRVAQEVSRMGARPLRVNTDGFPAELGLTPSPSPRPWQMCWQGARPAGPEPSLLAVLGAQLYTTQESGLVSSHLRGRISLSSQSSVEENS